MTAEGTPVRFLRSIFVPEDESCFFLYEARDPETVGEAVRRADLGAGPIRTTIPAGPEVLR